ncbi:hypothetical protein HELRODRAFT_178951 [Helobdella robusta]|uniref:Uncharacterized protein n=1 Tax=Helobdella robusta TaxID=6412 RepID=T1FDY1_HELRO|nr:hypothetical protein HELRODRAFT_178951 [Helobdella robusta]ESN95770.1 hypothetical protein HELRODRAFT_178951 [Helobdella robusta]
MIQMISYLKHLAYVDGIVDTKIGEAGIADSYKHSLIRSYEVSAGEWCSSYEAELTTVMEIEESLNKAEHTNLNHFCTGHHMGLKSYTHRIGFSDRAVCGLCETQVEDMDKISKENWEN